MTEPSAQDRSYTEAATHGYAKMIGQFWNGLRGEGMSRGEALAVVIAWLRATIAANGNHQEADTK
jgi:hypothetical protein